MVTFGGRRIKEQVGAKKELSMCKIKKGFTKTNNYNVLQIRK